MSGAAVAQDRAILAAHGITHVVNCVGALYPEYFKDDGIAYKTLWGAGERGHRLSRTREWGEFQGVSDNVLAQS